MSDIVIIRPGERASLAPTSSAFAHGFGLFETIRYANGRLHFWVDHWERLNRSAKKFALIPPDELELLDALRDLLTDLNEAVLKLSLLKDEKGCRLYVYTRPPLAAPEGRTLLLDTSCPIFERSSMAGHKTHNYMEAMHLLGLARAQGYFDTLRVDSQGNLAETTTANLFFIQGDTIYTPLLETGVLPGVTRAALLRADGLKVEEGLYAPERLLEADGVFVTNATGGLQPIEAIAGFSGNEAVKYDSLPPVWGRISAEFARIEKERAKQLF